MKQPRLPYLRKVFFLAHGIGFCAGIVFPFLAWPLVGYVALSPLFFTGCIFMGLTVGTMQYLFVRFTLRKQLTQQLDLLRPLAGDIALEDQTLEALQQAGQSAVSRVETLVSRLLDTIDQLFIHYRTLASAGQYLSERAHEGLASSVSTQHEVRDMEQLQNEIARQTNVLSQRTLEDTSLSAQLSASLKEMSHAMEQSTGRFLETSSSVDEMVSSIREVAAQSDEITRSTESTAQDLDGIGESLGRIRNGAFNSARAADEVKRDAENGLEVVRLSMEEMERIAQNSQKAMDAMERLAQQAGEVAKIIEVIKNMVSDTELLAFNAAIIAAKAGEEGKGFSVVAEEIRDLADRTTQSAREIEQIVKGINRDTQEATRAVETTSERIAEGKSLSQRTGEALTKIVHSAALSSESSNEIAELTGKEGERARVLLEDAGVSMRSIQAIARAMHEQRSAMDRIQLGVIEMRLASDKIAQALDEQVTANQDFNQSLAEREELIRIINNAIRHQSELSQKVFYHFTKSENRLRGNAERAVAISQEINEIETLADRLCQLTDAFEKIQVAR